MAYDFLNTTTYDGQLQQQADIGNYLANAATQHQDIQDVDPDLIEIASKVQEEQSSPDVQDEEPSYSNSDDDFDFEQDDAETDAQSATDMQLMSFLFNERPDDDPSNIGSVVGGSGADLSWLKRKTDGVNLNGLNPNISKYLASLPDEIKQSLVATSGDDDEHASNSKHYSHNAVDLRYNDDAYKYMENDPNFKASGLRVLPPNHGTAPHLHIESYKYGGIHINPANKGKFTASAEAHHMGVQEYARHVLSDPNASSTEKKRANFARNASHWQHAQVGGLFDTNKTGYVDSVLNANKQLDWVKRLYEKNPQHIQLPNQPYPSSHLMADDGNGYVFPSIIRQNGQLKYLGNSAEDYARRTNTGIQFPQLQGTWFANNGYKQGTGVLKNFQYGGTLYANDKQSQYVGLNHPGYNSAVLNLTGNNTIRGLDNNQPVAVTDGSRYKILIGNKDTAKFNGRVYEQRL
jgi:hypothetical protein